MQEIGLRILGLVTVKETMFHTVTLTFANTSTGKNAEVALSGRNFDWVSLLNAKVDGLTGTPHIVKAVFGGGLSISDLGNHENSISLLGQQIGTTLVDKYQHPGRMLTSSTASKVGISRLVQLTDLVDETGASVAWTKLTLVLLVSHNDQPDPHDSRDQHITTPHPNSRSSNFGRWSQWNAVYH